MNLEDLTFEVKNLTDTSIKFSSMREEVGIETYRLIASFNGKEEIGRVTFERMVELKDSQYKSDEFFYDTSCKPHKPRPFLFFMGVEEGYKGNNVAGLMVRKVNDYCKDEFGLPLYSGTCNRDSAKRVWEKLVDEGVAFECEYDGKRRWGLK